MLEGSVEEMAFAVELEVLVAGLLMGFVIRYFRVGGNSNTSTVPSEGTGRAWEAVSPM